MCNGYTAAASAPVDGAISAAAARRPPTDGAEFVCVLCGRESPTFAHAALRCPAMVLERWYVSAAVHRWQPRVGPDIAQWMATEPPDRRGLAALCGIVQRPPGTAALPPPQRCRMACELAAASADLARAYVSLANASGARAFYEPKHTAL